MFGGTQPFFWYPEALGMAAYGAGMAGKGAHHLYNRYRNYTNTTGNTTATRRPSKGGNSSNKYNFKFKYNSTTGAPPYATNGRWFRKTKARPFYMKGRKKQVFY